MNTLEACTIDTPFGDVGECSCFTIDDVLIPFTLHNIMTLSQQYTLSLWIKAVVEEGINKSLLVRGANMPATEEWTQYAHTFTAHDADLNIYFNNPGTYYIYHPQLERGNIATDWTESPLDTENKIIKAQNAADAANNDVQELAIKLEDSIQMLVAGINNGSLLEQTEDGWVLAGGGTKDQLLALSDALSKLDTSTNDAIEQLKEIVAANEKLSSYVLIDESGDQPVIKLGTYITNEETGESAFGKFSLQITSTAIEFLEDDEPIAWISNQELHITKATIEKELTVGGFVLKQHGTRNNVGFLWKGVTS